MKPADEAPLLPAPPIEPTDGPPPKIVMEILSMGEHMFTAEKRCGGGETEAGCDDRIFTDSDCVSIPEGETKWCDKTPPAQIRRQMLRQLRSEAPATGETGRLLARLPLSDGSHALFGEYLSRGAGYCTFEWGKDGGSGGPGECAEEDPCRDVCIGGSSGEDDRHVLLAGVVTADADGLWLQHEDGFVGVYPLTGPKLCSDPTRRVFLAETDHRFYYGWKLLREGHVIAEMHFPLPPTNAPSGSNLGEGWTNYLPD